jgi:hypothetical protein
MKKAQPEMTRTNTRRSGAAWGLTALAAACLLAACDTVQIPANLEPPAYYRPSNVYTYSATLPASLRRVALLPLTTATGAALEQSGVEELDASLRSELEKTKRFEVFAVSRDQMREWTAEAKTTWRADEPLPMDFFDKLQKETGSDAVMFCQITRYNPYPPLAVGWKMVLAAQGATSNSVALTLWQVDDVADAGDPQTAHAARTYYSQHVRTEQSQSDAGMILRSPDLFGQFSLSAIFGTIPSHE